MTRIVELRPLFVEAANTEFLFVNGVWEAGEQAERLAHEKGHAYYRWPHGGVSTVEAVEQIASADALVLAATSIAPTGIQQPADGEEAGRIIGERLLDPVSADRPDLHLVLISHFLVGHGVTHRNTNTGTWGLRTLEERARAGRRHRALSAGQPVEHAHAHRRRARRARCHRARARRAPRAEIRDRGADHLAPLPGMSFADGVWKHGSSVKEVATTITNGVQGTAMISWKSQLSDPEIQAMAAFVRKFDPKLASSKAPAKAPAKKKTGS